ncbi:MAG: hypothetical protein WC107_07380 [Patescibacteria group bacterium]
MKEAITIMGVVNSPEYGAEGHNCFAGSLTLKQLEQIEDLAATVVSKAAYAISIFDNSVEIFPELPVMIDAPEITQDDDERLVIADERTDLDDMDSETTEGMLLVVTTDSIYWSWTEKYGGACCETEEIPLSKLREAFA